MTLFEVTIVCKSLPRSINDTVVETHVDTTNSQRQVVQQHRNQIRHQKRQMLLKQLEDYESVIEQLEYVYQQELLALKLGMSSQTDRVEAWMPCINGYLHHRTERMMRDIRYRETRLRVKLKHPRHRSSTSSTCTTTSIYPEAIVETSCSVFNKEELDFLSSTGHTHTQLCFLAINFSMRLLTYLLLCFRWSELHQEESKFSLPREENSTKHATGIVQNSCKARP